MTKPRPTRESEVQIHQRTGENEDAVVVDKLPWAQRGSLPAFTIYTSTSDAGPRVVSVICAPIGWTARDKDCWHDRRLQGFY